MRAEEGASFAVPSLPNEPGERRVIGHVPCKVCKHGKAPLTKYAETLWTLCNVWLDRMRPRQESLKDHEVAVCGPHCYALWSAELSRPMLELLERDRQRAEQEQARNDDNAHGRKGRRL